MPNQGPGTDFTDGLFAQGVPVLPGAAGLVAFRNVYFVDGTYGDDANNGLGTGAGAAFATIQAALDVVRDSDAIVVVPAATYDEALTTGLCPGRPSVTPDAAAGLGRYVTLMGASNTKWAYDSPQIYNTSDGAAGIYVRSPGFRLSGFRIVGDTGSPICVKTQMAQSAATVGSVWAPGFQMDNCVIYGAVGSCSGLSMKGNGDFRILDNHFGLFASTNLGAIVDEGGGFTFASGRIEGNYFTNCKDNIVYGFGSTLIRGNIFADHHVNPITRGIVLTNGTSNMITQNFLGGAATSYSGGTMYIAAAGDNWAGNITTDDGAANILAVTPWTHDIPGS